MILATEPHPFQTIQAGVRQVRFGVSWISREPNGIDPSSIAAISSCRAQPYIMAKPRPAAVGVGTCSLATRRDPNMSYRCSKCGEEHEGLPDIGFDRPAAWFTVPDDERGA